MFSGEFFMILNYLLHMTIGSNFYVIWVSIQERCMFKSSWCSISEKIADVGEEAGFLFFGKKRLVEFYNHTKIEKKVTRNHFSKMLHFLSGIFS